MGADHRLRRRRALTSVVVEEMLTEAHEGETSVWGPILLTGGFPVFALISVYLGT